MACEDQVFFEFAPGEDLVAQFVWLDGASGLPIPFEVPAVLTMRDRYGDPILVFHDDTWSGIDPTTDPFLLCSQDVGAIQASAPRSVTAGMEPGNYDMDLWVFSRPVVGEEDYPIASQAVQVCQGKVRVRAPVTLF